MRDLDFSDNENPAFKSWKWMISDEDEEDDLDKNEKED
jgi:hypothetical protein